MSNGSSNTTTTDTPANHTNATSPFKVSQEEEEQFVGPSEVGRELGWDETATPSDIYSFFWENENIVTTDDAKKRGMPHHRSLPPPRNLNGEFSGPNKRHKTNN